MSFAQLPDPPVVPNLPDGADLSGLPELDLNLNDFEVPQISRSEPEPEPEPEPDNRTFLVLGLDIGNDDPVEDVCIMPIKVCLTVTDAVETAMELFGDRGVDQVQVRPMIGGKTVRYGDFWISENKESYNSRSARVGVTRPVFGKNYLTIDNVRDGVGDLLTLMNMEEDE